jgi:hypothetical protein
LNDETRGGGANPSARPSAVQTPRWFAPFTTTRPCPTNKLPGRSASPRVASQSRDQLSWTRGVAERPLPAAEGLAKVINLGLDEVHVPPKSSLSTWAV